MSKRLLSNDTVVQTTVVLGHFCLWKLLQVKGLMELN